jgi:DNA-directed RNA polymerase alpha subunit
MTQPTAFVLSCIESKKLEATQLYGCFGLGNFPKGQALTLANGLRRSLLSQVMGTAICFVEIKGASHEYQSLEGVHECVLDILLNLRLLVLKSSIPCFPTQLAYLHVKGPGVARARDLKTPNFISIVDPNQPIATLSTKGQLHLKVLITCGKSFLNQTPSGQTYEKQINLLKQRSWLGIQNQVPLTKYSNYWQRERFVKKKLIKNQSKNEQGQVPENQSQALKNYVDHSKPFASFNQTKTQQKDQVIREEKDQVIREEKDQVIREEKDQVIREGPKLQSSKQAKNLNVKNLTMESKQLKTKDLVNETIGYFPLDTIFAPVTKVNYTIESVNKIQEKVYFEIWTNGSLDPRQAIHQAAKALINLFLPLQLTSTTAMLPRPVLKTKNEPPSLRTRFAAQKQTQGFSSFTLPGFTQTLNKIKTIQQTNIKLPSPLTRDSMLGTQTFNRLIKYYLQTKPTKILQMVKRILKPKMVFLPTKYRVQKTKSTHNFPPQTFSEAVLELDNKSIEIEFHDVGLFLKSKPKNPIKPLFSKWFKTPFLTLPKLKKPKALKKSKTSLLKSSGRPGSKLKGTQLNKQMTTTRFKKLVLKRSFFQFKHKMLFTDIGQLKLSDSTYEVLKTHHIHTIYQLISISSQHFKHTPSLQNIDLSELKKRITEYVLYSLYTISTSQ